MATQQQIDANRKNATQSTGPRSPTLHQHHRGGEITLRGQEKGIATAQLEALLCALGVPPSESPADTAYASLRTYLEPVRDCPYDCF